MARGLVDHDSTELLRLLGRSSTDLASEEGPGYERELVHRDDLVLLGWAGRPSTPFPNSTASGRGRPHWSPRAARGVRVSQTRLWHVTVTVAGRPVAPASVQGALTRLAAQHGFLHSLRYAGDRAEITYWDEAPEMLDAAAMAMRVWDEHRVSADLPRWQVVGLEVLEQSVHVVRTTGGQRGSGGPRLGSRTPRPVPY